MPEHRRGPRRPLRLVRGLRRRQGPHLRAHAGGRRLQRRRTRSRGGWSRTPRSSRAVGRSASRSGVPDISMLGVVEEILVDRAFVPDRRRGRPGARPPSPTSGRRRRTTWPTPWPPPRWPGRYGVACAASPRRAARASCPPLTGSPTSGTVGRRRGTSTTRRPRTAHAAQTSLMAYDRVVWIAGGLAKGQAFDDLVRSRAGRMTRRRAARSGPEGDRRCARATRTGCAGDRGDRAPTLVPW